MSTVKTFREPSQPLPDRSQIRSGEKDASSRGMIGVAMISSVLLAAFASVLFGQPTPSATTSPPPAATSPTPAATAATPSAPAPALAPAPAPSAAEGVAPPAEEKTPAAPPSTSPTAKADAVSDEKTTPIVPWEYAPYQVRIWVAADLSPDLDRVRAALIVEQLRRRLSTILGTPWNLTVESPPQALAGTLATCPELVTPERLQSLGRSLQREDKLFWVRLAATPQSDHVWVREFDWHTRSFGRIVPGETRQSDAIADTALTAILAAFRPLARIEEGSGKSCVIRSRATGLVVDAAGKRLDPVAASQMSEVSPVMVRRGDILEAIFRQNDRTGQPMPGRTETLPFTYLQVVAGDSLNPSLLTCNVHSAMRSPIRGRSILTSRRERWALVVRPEPGKTRLVVEVKAARRNDPRQPLAGIEVYAKTPEIATASEDATEADRAAAEKRNPPEFLGVTDWQGTLSIPASPSPLRLVYLKNGGLLLARLPIVPGLSSQVVAEVPDDNPRLQAEGYVQGMNSEVMDLVVQRQIIALRVRKKISEGQLDEAERLLEEFRGLKTLNDLQQMLNVQQQRQKQATNTAVKMKIDQLYGDERGLLAKHIDAELQVKLLSELNQARAKGASPLAEPSAEKSAEKSEPPAESKGAP